MEKNTEALLEISKELRKKIFKMCYKAGGGHVAPSLSIVELLTVLYFSGIMHYNPKQPDWAQRDRFILSKGHASAALYAALAQAGFFDQTLLESYCQMGSNLGGHPNMHEVPGVEASTGALGHGFLFAVGVALAGKMDHAGYRVFSIIGDGECQEGSIWEAALFASHKRLGRLTAIVDFNKIQAMDFLDHIVKLEPFVDKWRAFGWETAEVDGHNINDLIKVLGPARSIDGPPLAVIAHTVKGKGISFMENVPIWHYRMPDKDELKIVLEELQIKNEDGMFEI